VSSIFRDKEKLSPYYIPERLPHRERELRLLRDALDESLSLSSPVHVQIVGDVGSGKTVTVLKFSRESSEERRDLRFAYVNPRQHGTSRLLIFRTIARQVAPEAYSASLSPEELMQGILKRMADVRARGVIIVDDVDYAVARSKEPIIYSLTRLNEAMPGEKVPVLMVVFTARSARFRELLDRSEVSSLGNRVIYFERYSKDQIIDILQRRVAEAFRPGTIEEKVVEYIAEITSSYPINGDVRYAIDLLLNAGSLAEAQGSQRVTLEHVRKVVSYTSPSITQEEIASLDRERREVLLAVVRSLKESNEPYVSLDKIYDVYRNMGKNVPLGEFIEMVQDLGDRGMIDIKGLTKIGISGAPVENLEAFLENLIKRL